MRRGNKCNRNCTAGGTSRASTPSYGKNMDAVFTIDKGTLESAIAIVPRYILNRHFPDTRTHCYTNATCTPGSDSSHIVRANYQTLSSRAQPIEVTNNCPDTGRNNIGTEDHDRRRFRLGYSWNISICREITGETAFSITRDGVMTEITRSIVERCRTPDFLNSLLPSSVTTANDRQEFRSWNGWNATAGPENKPSQARPWFR